MDFLVPCENLPGCMLLGGLLSSANGLGGDSNPKPPGPKPLIFHRKGVFFFELHPLLEFHQSKSIYVWYGIVETMTFSQNFLSLIVS